MGAFSEVRYLVAIDRETEEWSELTPGSSLFQPIAVTVDQSNGFIFFTDVFRREIWRKDFKTAGARSEVIRNLESGKLLSTFAKFTVKIKCLIFLKVLLRDHLARRTELEVDLESSIHVYEAL